MNFLIEMELLKVEVKIKFYRKYNEMNSIRTTTN